jgi:iron complex transport system ATP-binding protein
LILKKPISGSTNQVLRYANHIVMLKDGKFFAEGAPQAVMQEDNLQQVFGVRCRIITDPQLGVLLCIPVSRNDKRRFRE